MTKILEIGSILQVSPVKRMVYLGDGFARGEMFHPERSATFGLTNSGSGEWLAPSGQPDRIKLNDQQITFWLSKIEG